VTDWLHTEDIPREPQLEHREENRRAKIVMFEMCELKKRRKLVVKVRRSLSKRDVMFRGVL